MNPTPNPLYVEKKTILVHLHLVNGMQIIGHLHFAPRIRITDTLNFQVDDKPFLPITNVQIISPQGEETKAPFMVVNRKAIVSCLSLEQL